MTHKLVIVKKRDPERDPSLRSMAVLLSRAEERRSREKNKNQVASAPIFSRFLCPRPTLLLSAPN